MGKKSGFTSAEIEEIKRLYLQEGRSILQIPKILGKGSENSVRNALHKARVKHAPEKRTKQDRSPLLQIQTLDLFDLSTCEARFLAHLLPAFDLSLSGGAQAPSTFSEAKCQPVGMIPLDQLLQRLAGVAGMESGSKQVTDVCPLANYLVANGCQVVKSLKAFYGEGPENAVVDG